MTTPNEIKTIAQCLREYKDSPHHNEPMSEAFYALITDAANMLSLLASSQIMGRVHHTENGVVCALNSVGQQLSDDTPLYTHPAKHEETDAESRAAWIAVVLQKCPLAEINVAGDFAQAKSPNGTIIGSWTPGAWSVK